MALVTTTACPGRGDPRCAGKNASECAWDKAVRGDRPAAATGDEVEAWRDPGEASRTPDDEWTRATEILGEAWTLMGEGVEGDAVAAQAKKWCDPNLVTGPSTPERKDAWSCDLEDPPRLSGRALRLEVGDEGVVALSVANLGEGEATALIDGAAERWGPLCTQRAFGEMPARGPAGTYRGCVLKDGPLLVLSRFRPEPETPLWQVSLSVMPAG